MATVEDSMMDTQSGAVERAAPRAPHLTVIDMEDWSLLFVGEKLVHQNHQTTIGDVETAGNGKPFTLHRIAGFNTVLEEQINEQGQCPPATTLSQAAALLERAGGAPRE